MKTFTLYWKNIEIGVLTETNWDMRNGGYIEFIYNYPSEELKNKHLSEYIMHSIQASKYLNCGDDTNYKRVCQEENKFLDLINNSEWKNKNGEMWKILCPIFHENNEITWQKGYDC